MILQRHFFWLNLILVLAISLMLWLRDTSSPWVTAGGAYMTGVFILSNLLYQVQPTLVGNKQHLISLLLFTLILYLTQGIAELVLARFFRIDEQYAFNDFLRYFKDHPFHWIDGLIWWCFYQAIFFYMKMQIQFDAVTEISKTQAKEINEIHKQQLRNELNPHFLFNAMNSIAMKVRLNENHTAVDMIAALNELLRASIKPTGNELITVEKELQLLEKYLFIERHRFGDEATVVQFSEKARRPKIPELLLQPIVENAFKHARMQTHHKPQVKVYGEVVDDQLIITVFNTSQPIKMIQHQQTGIGLSNVINRLRRHFGLNFKFQSFLEKEGITIKMTIPIVVK